MRCVIERAKSDFSMVDLLDNVCMSERNRALAKIQTRDAEFIVELIYRTAEDLHTVIALVERGVMGLARRVKSMFVRPAQR